MPPGLPAASHPNPIRAGPQTPSSHSTSCPVVRLRGCAHQKCTCTATWTGAHRGTGQAQPGTQGTPQAYSRRTTDRRACPINRAALGHSTDSTPMAPLLAAADHQANQHHKVDRMPPHPMPHDDDGTEGHGIVLTQLATPDAEHPAPPAAAQGSGTTAAIHLTTPDAERQFSVHRSTGYTSRQQQSMLLDGRDWQAVRGFWRDVVAGHACLSDLQPPLNPPQQYIQDLEMCDITLCDAPPTPSTDEDAGRLDPSTSHAPPANSNVDSNSQHTTHSVNSEPNGTGSSETLAAASAPDSPTSLSLLQPDAQLPTCEDQLPGLQGEVPAPAASVPDSPITTSTAAAESKEHLSASDNQSSGQQGEVLAAPSSGLDITAAAQPEVQLSASDTQPSGQQGGPATPGEASSSSGRPHYPPRRKKTNSQERLTYKVALAYYGPSFDGWAKQTGDPRVKITVEGAVCAALLPLMKPGSSFGIAGAGRTDRGVSAAAQVFSFYSWVNPPLTQPALAHAILTAPGVPLGSLRLVASAVKPRTFHAQFSATWRRYVYLLPLRPAPAGSHLDHTSSTTSHVSHTATATMSMSHNRNGALNGTNASPGHSNQTLDSSLIAVTANDDSIASKAVVDAGQARAAWLQSCLEQGGPDVDADVVHALLQPLVGRALDFTAYARDTPKGKETTCFLQLARATRVRLPAAAAASSTPAAAGTPPVADASTQVAAGTPPPAVDGPVDSQGGTDALCIELVADRFLRKMVRVLVSTVVMEAMAIQASARHPGQPPNHQGASAAAAGRGAEAQTGSSQCSVDTHTAGAAGAEAPAVSQPGQGSPHDSSTGNDGSTATVDGSSTGNALDFDPMLVHCRAESTRQETCVPAPAEGLCFAGVGYDKTSWQ